MNKRNRYPSGSLARAGRAFGSSTLLIPFMFLWKQFEDAFLLLAVRRLTAATVQPPMAQLLERHELGKSALNLRAFFDDYRVRTRSMPTTVAGLLALSQWAEDLARDDGRWKEDARELEAPAREAMEALMRCIEAADRELERDYGYPAAKKLIEDLKAVFTARLQCLESDGRLDLDKLRSIGVRFRTAAQPRHMLIRLLLRIWPNLPASHWLSEPERNTLERSLLAELNRTAASRYAGERTRAERSVLNALLGNERTTGFLEKLWRELSQREAFFAELAVRPAAHTAASRFCEVLVLRDLHDVIDPNRKRTLCQFWLAECAATGVTPERFAQRLLQHGLNVQGRRIRPADWPKCELNILRKALHKAVRKELGSADPNRPLAIRDPQSPLDRIGSHGLLSAEYRHVLGIALERWLALSRPYCTAQAIPGHEPSEKSYLFCHQLDRAQWLKRIDGYVPGLERAESPSDADAYSIKHPFVVVLHRAQFSIPLGALTELPRFRRALTAQRREGKLPILHDHRSSRDLGVLGARPDDYQDCEKLVQAAERASVLIPFGGRDDLLVLARPDNRLASAFAPGRRASKWLFDEDVLQRLRHSVDRHALTVAFAGLDAAQLTRWAETTDAESVCRFMVEAGALEAGPQRLYRLRQHSAAAETLTDWHTREEAPLMGLPRTEIINLAYWNHLFYSVLFFAVFDALDEQRLGPGEVPSFLFDYWRRVGD